MVVSDEEIVARIVEVLEKADLTTTTTSAIRRQLEEDLGIDLTDKKAFIREQVDLYLQAQQQQEQEQQQQQYMEGEEPEVQYEEDAGDDGAEEEEDDEEEDGDHPEPDSRRFQAKIDRAKKDSLQKEKKKRRSGGGLNKLCGLSPELQAFIGEKELPRTQVVKLLWVYIREKNLQDPENRRKIICDDALRALLGCDSTDMFKMNKLLSKHIWPLDSPGDGEEPKPPKRPKPDKKEAPEKEGGKGRVTGFTAPLPLSEALINFLGTGESELSRAEVVKRIWDYIKGNQLQDPADKRRILCDSKLQELFGCETFNGFGMTKHLSPHFIKG